MLTYIEWPLFITGKVNKSIGCTERRKRFDAILNEPYQLKT